MIVKPLIISVRRIHNDTPSTGNVYVYDDILTAAKSILAGGGVINPLVVKRRGFEEYDLLHGEFEYLAAQVALKLDPIKGETIDAYVIDETNEAIMLQQLRIFRGIYLSTSNQDKPVNDKKSGRSVRLTDEQRALLPDRWLA